jgi:hypothetical protein
MHQINWLRGIATSVMNTCPFNPNTIRLWSRCSVEDDTDALGCIIMGGEL